LGRNCRISPLTVVGHKVVAVPAMVLWLQIPYGQAAANGAFKNAACLGVFYNCRGGYGANPTECSCPAGFMLH